MPLVGAATFLAVVVGLVLVRALPPPHETCWGPLPHGAHLQDELVKSPRPDIVVPCNNASDCTADIQSALDGASNRMLVFRGTYVTTPLLLRANNTALHFEPGSVLIAKQGAFLGGADTLLQIQGAMWGQACNATCFCPVATNVTITGFGARFQMRRTEYTLPPYHPTENRMAVSVYGLVDLTIQGVSIEDAGGDGIYLGQVLNRNITISQVVIARSFRNALTVGNVVNLQVLDTILTLTNGTAPMAGVDFEADQCYSLMQDIVFRNVSALENSGWGFGFTLGPSPDCSPWGGQTPITADFQDIAVDGTGSYGFKVSANGPFPPGGHLTVKNMRVANTLSSGLLVEDKGGGWPFRLENAVFSNVSTPVCPTPSGECPNGPLWIEGRNEQCEDVYFRNVTVDDDRPRWAVSLEGALANISGSLHARNPHCIGQPGYPNVSLSVLCERHQIFAALS